MGFEPTVAKGYTRSPGVPDRPLQHLSTIYMVSCFIFYDFLNFGGEGGIRTHAPLNTETAFRERHHKPLGHLSPVTSVNYTIEGVLAVYFTDLLRYCMLLSNVISL